MIRTPKHRPCVLAGSLLASVLTLLFVVPAAASAQESNVDDERTTTTGVVSVSTPTTLVVRGENRRHQVFVYGRGATRPGSVAVGSRVSVVSTPGAERGVRVASRVAVTSPPPTGDAAAAAADEDVVPDTVRDLERSVRRQVSRYNVGVRAGIA